MSDGGGPWSHLAGGEDSSSSGGEAAAAAPPPKASKGSSSSSSSGLLPAAWQVGVKKRFDTLIYGPTTQEGMQVWVRNVSIFAIAGLFAIVLLLSANTAFNNDNGTLNYMNFVMLVIAALVLALILGANGYKLAYPLRNKEGGP